MNKKALIIAILVSIFMFLVASLQNNFLAFPYFTLFLISMYYMIDATDRGVLLFTKTIIGSLLGIFGGLFSILIFILLGKIIGLEKAYKILFKPDFFMNFLEWVRNLFQWIDIYF